MDDSAYSDFDNQNRKLAIIIGGIASVVIAVQLIVIILLFSQRQFFIWENAPLIDNRITGRDICWKGFESILRKKSASSLVTKNYFDYLEKTNYRDVIDANVGGVELDNFFREIKMLNDVKCKVVIKDSNLSGHGLRVFVVGMDKNPDHIFGGYKVANIAEHTLSDDDLRWR